MHYREYGSTGKKVSVLGFGGMRFPGDLVSSGEGRAKCAELVIKASELGINFFDTTHEYCGGHSEEIYGLAFKQMKKNYYVSSKSGWHFDKDADAVRRRIENSIKTMGIEKINFFHMWRILDMEQYINVMRPGGPYEGALKAKEEGLIEHICFSTHCKGEEIETIVKNGGYDGLILGYNILNSSFRKRGLEAARDHKMGVAIMNPLAGGVIPRNASFFKSICKEGETVVDAALRFVIKSSGVTLALSGISNEQELLENVGSVEKIDFSSEYDDLSSFDEKQFNDLCTGCNYCAGCVKGIAISKLMLAYNQSIIEHDNPAALGNALHEWWNYDRTTIFPCVKCGACERKCTQHLPIISRIEEINDQAMTQRNRARVNLENVIGGSRTVGLYGAGSLAKVFFKECKETETIVPEIFLFDSNPDKWDKEIIPGYRVHSPKDIKPLGIERLIVCVSSDVLYDRICSDLHKMGINDIVIVRYKTILE